jgi:hypothetical protein
VQCREIMAKGTDEILCDECMYHKIAWTVHVHGNLACKLPVTISHFDKLEAGSWVRFEFI